MHEEWRSIPGVEGYEASSLGRVRSSRGVLKLQGTNRNYLSVIIRKKTRLVHALVCEAFHGPRPEGAWVRHLNGKSHDNRVENLLWGTPQENVLDTLAHGKNVYAARTHCPKRHEFTPENTIWRKNRTNGKKTSRKCRACKRQNDAARRLAKKTAAATVMALALMVLLPEPHGLSDMCGPSNLPILSYMHPWVKGCQAYLPGAGNLPQIPVVQPPGTAPAPIYVPPWGSWVRP